MKSHKGVYLVFFLFLFAIFIDDADIILKSCHNQMYALDMKIRVDMYPWISGIYI